MKFLYFFKHRSPTLSPPARGAWIEIMMEGYSIYRMLSDRAKDLKAKADAK